MLGYLYTSSLREFLAPRRILAWIAVIAAVCALGAVWLHLTETRGTFGGYARLSEMLVFRFSALLAAVMATSVIAAEVEQRTIVYLLTRPVPRGLILLGRALAAITVVGLLSNVTLVAASIVVYGPNLGANPHLLRDLLGLWLVGWAYGGLFVLISLILNRALVYCLVYAFGWEFLAPTMPGELYFTSLQAHLKGFVQHPEVQERPGRMLSGMLGGTEMAVPPQVAWISLLAVGAVALAVGMQWFTRFEYAAREDAA